jgi:hypothetical protein
MEPVYPSLQSFDDFNRRRRLDSDRLLIFSGATERPFHVHQAMVAGGVDPDLSSYLMREILNLEEFRREVRVSTTLRELLDKCARANADIDSDFYRRFVLIHPHIDGMRVDGFMYALYKPHTGIVDLPAQTINVGKMLFDGNCFLHFLHERNYVHGNIHPVMFAIPGANAESAADAINYIVRSSQTMCRMRDMCSYSDSWILSPLQIILEMLGSAIEPPEIDYVLFKTRLLAFWRHLLLKQLGNANIIEDAKAYFSLTSGCSDYVDYCISRYCMITSDGKRVVKNRAKGLGYLRDIDLFALGMSAHMILRTQSISGLSGQPALVIKQAIGLCVKGDYIAIPKPPPGNANREVPAPPITPVPPVLAKQIQKAQVAHLIDEPKQVASPAPQQEQDKLVQKECKSEQKTKEKEKEKEKEVINDTVRKTLQPAPEITPMSFMTIAEGINIEMTVTGSLKKARISEGNKALVERVVRTDVGGEYLMWRGSKLYIG